MRRVICATAMILVGAGVSRGDIVAVGPFVGDRSENFDDRGGGGGGLQTDSIFGNAVTINNLTSGGAIKYEFSSTLIVNGIPDQVLPRSAPTMMGQLGVLEWIFHTPVERFGGYYENNSFVDDATIEFFGAQNQLLGVRTASVPFNQQDWTWNGWQSDLPIYRMVSTGHNANLLNGFIWYDDMEITFSQIPEPGAGAILTAGLFLSVVCLRGRVRRIGCQPSSAQNSPLSAWG